VQPNKEYNPINAEIMFTMLSIASEKTASELVRCQAMSFPTKRMTPNNNISLKGILRFLI
jgi:hypothetical protein